MYKDFNCTKYISPDENTTETTTRHGVFVDTFINSKLDHKEPMLGPI